MRIIVESRDLKAASVRDLTAQRVRLALRRFASVVSWVKVNLSDVNGTRGGIDKRCQIELKTSASSNVVTTSVARDWRIALDDALQRSTQRVVRHSQRQKPCRGREQRLRPDFT